MTDKVSDGLTMCKRCGHAFKDFDNPKATLCNTCVYIEFDRLKARIKELEGK